MFASSQRQLDLARAAFAKTHCAYGLGVGDQVLCACMILWAAEKIFEDGFHLSLVGFVGLAFVVAWASLQA